MSNFAQNLFYRRPLRSQIWVVFVVVVVVVVWLFGWFFLKLWASTGVPQDEMALNSSFNSEPEKCGVWGVGM